MEFGLPPEFSTPVQKPVENGVLMRTDAKNGNLYRRFREAKTLRSTI
jgi:hypothetical protein